MKKNITPRDTGALPRLDPDLEINGGEGGGGRGRVVSNKIFFLPFGPQFGLK